MTDLGNQAETPLHPEGCRKAGRSIEVHGLAKMTLGSWRYYDREVAQGMENYYTAAGEEPGSWIGTGAARAGLSGQVDGDQLQALFDEGCHPVTRDPLGRPFV